MVLRARVQCEPSLQGRTACCVAARGVRSSARFSVVAGDARAVGGCVRSPPGSLEHPRVRDRAGSRSGVAPSISAGSMADCARPGAIVAVVAALPPRRKGWAPRREAGTRRRRPTGEPAPGSAGDRRACCGQPRTNTPARYADHPMHRDGAQRTRMCLAPTLRPPSLRPCRKRTGRSHRSDTRTVGFQPAHCHLATIVEARSQHSPTRSLAPPEHRSISRGRNSSRRDFEPPRLFHFFESRRDRISGLDVFRVESTS